MSTRLLPLALAAIVALAAGASAAPPSVEEMAARIDALLLERLAEEGLEPAPLADDGEFLRRATLDLTGTIPAVNGENGVRTFLDDQRPDKRKLLIGRLLARPTHASHLANVWRDVMLPSDDTIRRLGGDTVFQRWLFEQFSENVPYDHLVTSLLVADGNTAQVGPALFYTALQLKPEGLAASTSRIFLGVQIQCAQCHNHPFDHWTQDDFWSYAAFFARLERPQGNQQFARQVVEGDSGEVHLPGTEDVALPRFLSGDLSPDGDLKRRLRLATWLTARENPYFARATVNRVWAHLFGRGIVDPVDDLGDHNPPSHPQLLDELADYFVATGFDLRRLFLTLASTQAYQRTSRGSEDDGLRPELFGRMAIKSLTADEIYDCLLEAMRRRETGTTGGFASGGGIGAPREQGRQAFLNRFRAPTQGATEFQAGIPQALTLMNGALMELATDVNDSDILAVLDAPFYDDEQRVETLFLSVLARRPNEQERATFVAYLEKAPSDGRRRALGDILWALLNSAEFILNH